MGSILVLFRLLSGFKTYLAASGFVGLALHHFSAGLTSEGLQSLLTAAVAAALRQAIGKLQS